MRTCGQTFHSSSSSLVGLLTIYHFSEVKICEYGAKMTFRELL